MTSFTATLRPSSSSATCTCATEALATGSASKRRNTWVSGLPSSRSTARLLCAAVMCGVWSCSTRSVDTQSGPNRSERVAAIWPILM
ncbi:Uncharacterised protein [Mycobacteroides abscessus subsp. abscessus]|nr:Uncharacterised protein [Mycobacteroides abscessus subsp. abscessus]